MRVREDVTRQRDGDEGTFAVIEKADFALGVPYEHSTQNYRA